MISFPQSASALAFSQVIASASVSPFQLMFFSGGQCGHVGRPEELLLMFKIALVVIFLHITLVTSLEGSQTYFLGIMSLFSTWYVPSEKGEEKFDKWSKRPKSNLSYKKQDSDDYKECKRHKVWISKELSVIEYFSRWKFKTFKQDGVTVVVTTPEGNFEQ
ncbi:hypothetical protein E5288_WYG021859 [Bos mutus]|uniref:Uncharacterized protein n=1 Tax=Bos mutus TaxID=72004 RepID=A0A6B0SFB5_9CETA|nr:hypothetical protein [Bos mutus]